MSKESYSKNLQECIDLIKEMTTIIDPSDDYLTITAAEEQMKVNYAKGKREIDDAYSNLKSLSRVLEAARKSSTRPPGVPTAGQHAAYLDEMEVSRMSLAKAIRDAESTLAAKEAELTALKEESTRLERSDPARDHQLELDGTALRLQIYRGLGFEPVLADGIVKKMIIRSESGDINSIPLNSKSFENEQANQLWKFASS
ncbi:hypothetical protein CONPUDRAFT_134809 [Coniophora puteana RWD-64-598 SS2]|uniref:Kinetochore protein Spc24 n=1 Tax=Coniophora puteana (strain RWD-64-598) TaxID=741705 RepID=A0A5M3N0Q7_CONPW|nr:uncharacterized protein CONPUDRAFT_134809 [Coniophora puteana RWD-64-598 SS2]EIW84958.1 hypothetical protein CONPUDRAFT_134809 [Coniophora puteana RWD-64-598 SS2]